MQHLLWRVSSCVLGRLGTAGVLLLCPATDPHVQQQQRQQQQDVHKGPGLPVLLDELEEARHGALLQRLCKQQPTWKTHTHARREREARQGTTLL